MNSENIEKDSELFARADRMAGKISTIINVNGDLESDKELNDYISQHKEQITSRLKDSSTADRIHAKVKSKNKIADINRLEVSLRQNRRRGIAKTLKIISVAAAIAIVSLLVFYQNQQPTIIVSESFNNKITEPTLIIGDNQMISLQSDSKSVDERDYKIEKVDGKKLVYTSSDTMQTINYNTLVVPAGYTYTIVMDDKSEVKLNAGATLRYPTKFVGANREVELQGEAYFKVTKSDKPFIVNSKGIKVKVYGTEFNVRAAAEESIETVLVEGSVGILLEDGSEVMMIPNQQLSYNCNTKKHIVREVNTEDYTMWCSDLFRFKNRSLEDVLLDLSAWYNIRFTSKIDLKEINVTMTMGHNEPLGEVLPFIEKLLNITIVNEGKGEYSINR